MNLKKEPLRGRLKGNPRPSIGYIVFFTAVVALMAFAGASGVGGILCPAVSGAAFAYFFCTLPNLYYLCLIPISFGAAFAASGDIYVSLTGLLFVPVGLVLGIMVFKKKSLSQTVALMTVAFALSVGGLICVYVMHIYGEGLTESLRLFKAQVGETLRDVLSKLTVPTAEGTKSILSDEAIEGFIESVKLILPATCILICQLAAYICAKIFRFTVRLTLATDLLEGRPWGLTLSVPAAIIYVGSFFIGMFVPVSSPVLAYSLLNLMMILLPCAAITGIKSFLLPLPQGKRRSPVLIVLCCVLFFLSPIMALEIFALMSSVTTLLQALAIRKIKKNQK